MFEIEDSDDYGSPPVSNSSKFGSGSQFHKPVGGKSQKSNNSLFGGTSVYDDDDAYNFSAPIDKKYANSMPGKQDKVLPAFSPREEPEIPSKTGVSALDKAHQMLQKYSKGPVRAGSFTSAPVSSKFKTGRADLSYDENVEMSSEEEEEEESQGPESFGDLSISSPGLAKKKLMQGMQRAQSSSALPTASTILENKPKTVSISNQNTGNNNGRKGMILTNPEQLLEESIPEEDEDEEEISEEDEENGDDDDDEDEYGYAII